MKEPNRPEAGQTRLEAPLTPAQLLLELESLRKQNRELQELVKFQEADLALLQGAFERLKPGMDPKALGEALLDLCFRPLNLNTFYLALMDWESGLLSFPTYQDAGSRSRHHPSRSLAGAEGLTGYALNTGVPLYCPDYATQDEFGVKLNDSEKRTGLISQSWYGVPLFAGGGRPFGLVSYQNFYPDSFSEHRRRLMDALAQVLALAAGAWVTTHRPRADGACGFDVNPV